MKKNLISVFIIMLMVATMFPLSSLKANATTYTVSNLSSLNEYTFRTVAEGSYSAVKRSGKWTYKFTKGRDVVYIPVSAFSGSCSNPSTSSINNAFTNAIKYKKPPQDIGYVYRTKRAYTYYWTYEKKTSTCYQWDFTKYNLTENYTSESITLGNFTNGTMRMVYNTKIMVSGKGAKAPSTAAEYKRALTVSKNNTIVKKPSFKVRITNPGKNKVYLSAYKQTAKGYTSKKGKVNVADAIDVLYKTAQCTAGAVSGAGGQECLGAVMSAAKFAYNSSGLNKRMSYGWSPERMISGYSSAKKKTLYMYSSDFTSTLKSQTPGDYFQVKTYLSDPISRTGKKATSTDISISFALK